MFYTHTGLYALPLWLLPVAACRSSRARPPQLLQAAPSAARMPQPLCVQCAAMASSPACLPLLPRLVARLRRQACSSSSACGGRWWTAAAGRWSWHRLSSSCTRPRCAAQQLGPGRDLGRGVELCVHAGAVGLARMRWWLYSTPLVSSLLAHLHPTGVRSGMCMLALAHQLCLLALGSVSTLSRCLHACRTPLWTSSAVPSRRQTCTST